MAIKQVDFTNPKMTLKLRSGRVYRNCDIPETEQSDGMVGIIFEGRLRLYPMDLIEYAEAHEDEGLGGKLTAEEAMERIGYETSINSGGSISGLTDKVDDLCDAVCELSKSILGGMQEVALAIKSHD